MTPKLRVAFGIGAVVVAALVALGLRGEARLVELAEVKAAPLRVTTQEEGKTRLRNRYLVSAPVAGTVRRVALEQGDTVTAGQVVAELEPAMAGLLDPASLQRTEAEARAAADANRAAKARIRGARAAAEFARQELQRLMNMSADSAVSRSQLESARTQATQADADLAAAIADERSTDERRRALDAVISQQGRSGGIAVLPLTSPVAGMLIRRFQESAAPVASGQPLVEIGDPSDIEIEVEALSTEAVKLRPGMKARVLRWGGDGELDATVLRIEPGGFTKVSALGVEEQRVRVILDLVGPRDAWASLGDAYRVEVEFVLSEAASVLQIPSSALFRRDGAWYVFVAENDRAHRVAVEIGSRGGLATEVRGGLKAGQFVITHPDDRIVEGVRVRTAK